MSKHITVLGIVIIIAMPLLAQIDPNAELAEKQLARQQARAATTQITVGQYDDMQDEIALLKAEVAGMRSKLALAGNSRQPQIVQATPAKKVYKQIQLGMTKDELIDFVSRHPDMELGDFSSHTITPDSRHPSTNPTEIMSKVTVTKYAQETVQSGSQQFGSVQAKQLSKVAVAHYYIELTDDIITSINSGR